MVGPDSYPSVQSLGGHHHSGHAGKRVQVFHSVTPSHGESGREEQTARDKQGGARVVTNHTLDTCKVCAPIHVGPVLFLPCSAGHSESSGQVGVKGGTGKLEYLRTFDISYAHSLGAGWGGGGRGWGSQSSVGPVWTSAVQEQLQSMEAPSLLSRP